MTKILGLECGDCIFEKKCFCELNEVKVTAHQMACRDFDSK